MEDRRGTITYSAVKESLLYGLYTEPDQNKLEKIQYHSAVSFFPENTRRQRIKAKLKKNRFVYGTWLKYKEIRDRRAAKSSVGVRVKNSIKKQKAVRFFSNKLREPGRVNHNHEMILTLLEVVTSVSQKCDDLCIQIEEIKKQMENIKKQMENIDTSSRKILTSVYSNTDLMAGLHEKLDCANTAILQTEGQLTTCKTVVNTNEVICVQYDWDLLLGVPATDWRLAMYLSRGGHFEYGTELLFRKTVKPGMKVLDIGANVGIYSIHGLKCGADLYSFEPTPSVFRILKHNIAVNGFENSSKAHLYNYAVSDQSGSVRFAEIEGACGQNNMFSTIENGSYTEVKTVKIDDLLEGIQIDCFKMDIEGAEMLALKGMEKLLGANQDICGFVEFAPSILRRADVDPQDYYERLKELGFVKMWSIDEGNGNLTPVRSYEEIQNETSINLYIKKA